MVGTNITGANFGATSQAAFTMPQAADPSRGTSAVCKQTGGGPMCEAIYSAKSTVGAVYYQFAGPNVTRWLKDALLRGVDVFVIENSANTTPGSNAKSPLCQTVSATDPQCAWSPKADPFYALEAQLKSVVKSDGSTGQVRVQFSSQNFNITHQKSILVDVLDSKGGALDAGTIQSQGGFAIVSTGNLQAYPNSWGQRTISGKLANVDYLTNPAATCPGGDETKCADEWTPRDFAMRVTDPAILARVAGVYASDLRCDPAGVTNVQSRASSPTRATPTPPARSGRRPGRTAAPTSRAIPCRRTSRRGTSRRPASTRTATSHTGTTRPPRPPRPTSPTSSPATCAHGRSPSSTPRRRLSSSTTRR
jgi:hypothetical protein